MTFVPILFAAATATAAIAGEPGASLQPELHRETERLVIVGRHDSVSEQELELAKSKGESFHAAIREMLGEAPASKIVIALHGPAERADGSWGYPHVDGQGTIHLYRFTPSPEGYFSALAHEMVHAFRLRRLPHHDMFFEEGFAELVARRVDSSLAGFPWYGYPVELVAGQWIAGGEDIPLETMRNRHRSVNLPCKLQTYALRGSFFSWLGTTYGDDKLIAMSAAGEAGAPSDYERLLGKPFAALAQEWREALLARFRAVDDGETLARRYRRESPAQYIPVCGRDGRPLPRSGPDQPARMGRRSPGSGRGSAAGESDGFEDRHRPGAERVSVGLSPAGQACPSP